MKNITIADVAQKAGVSTGTVSAVMNEKSSVKAATREKVLTVMKDLNFRPKGMARLLKQVDVDKSIGLIIKDLNNPFYTSVAMGVKEYANEKGYLLLITSSENDHEYEERLSRLFTSKDIKGAIIASVLEGTAEIEHLFKLKMLNYPFVLLEDVKGIQANVVSIDNIEAMKTAVKSLVDAGHTKIVHFAGPENASHTHERIEGFRRAFSECPLIYSEDLVTYIGAHFDETFEKTMNYFQSTPKDEYPTAIICFNDQQAVGVMSALNQLSIRVPDDISIIGNDDAYFARLFHIPLSSIRAPMHEMGRKAAEILIQNIESSTPPELERVVLDAELIIRDSVKSLK